MVKVQWPSTVPEGPLDLAGLVAKQYPEVGSRNEFDLLTTEGLEDFSVTLAASAAACLSAASSTTKWACASCTSPQAVASAKALSPAMRLALCSILRLAPWPLEAFSKLDDAQEAAMITAGSKVKVTVVDHIGGDGPEGDAIDAAMSKEIRDQLKDEDEEEVEARRKMSIVETDSPEPPSWTREA